MVKKNMILLNSDTHTSVSEQTQSRKQYHARSPTRLEQPDTSPSGVWAGKQEVLFHSPCLPIVSDQIIQRNTGCDYSYQSEMQLDACGTFVFP